MGRWSAWELRYRWPLLGGVHRALGDYRTACQLRCAMASGPARQPEGGAAIARARCRSAAPC